VKKSGRETIRECSERGEGIRTREAGKKKKKGETALQAAQEHRGGKETFV